MTIYFIGRNGEDFVVNNTTAKFIGDMLEQMHANLDSWRWSSLEDKENYADKAVCKDWAAKLRSGVVGLRKIRVPDLIYANGYFETPLLRGIDLHKELKSGATAKYATWSTETVGGMGIDPRKVIVEPISEKTRARILSLAAFFDRCGGCWIQ